MLSGATALAQGDSGDVRFEALVNEAVKARNAGDLERTAAMLRQAIEVKPVPEMLNNLGSIYEDLGRYADAVEMYQKVVSNPGADGVLKRLDATRIELLTPKLDRAWLAIGSKAKDLKVFVDGAAADWRPGQEVPVKPGPAAVELATPDGKRTQVVFGNYEAGRRSAVMVSLGKKVTEMGRISWTKTSTRLKGFTVNGYGLSGDLGKLRAVHLAPGRYVVEGKQAGRTPVMKAVQVSAGKTQDLTAMLMGASEAVVPEGTTSAEIVVEGSDSSGAAIRWGTIGVGAALTGTGIALMSMATADRNQVKDAEVNGVMTMPMSEAVALEDSANTKGLAGSVLMGLGLAGAVGGAVWMVLDDDEPQTDADAWVAPTAGGLVMGWTF
ncbi:MAG: tetratricopeptide repeat protein [Myxococcota bacterium]|nr:tetratricopeptide repeat protein [Myxococcota bacterium]